ncbi:glutathione S-transferase family protein [bacterium]|nr:glutathione S-transferase family protein [bacterium]
MKLFFSPMTCSLATRIALCEAGLDGQVDFQRVDLHTRTLADGSSYLDISPKGAVAALQTEDGQLLTENAAILQYVADRAPASGLAPAAGSFERYRLQEWLSFVGTELHKHVFYSIFNPFSPEASRDYARSQAAPPRFAHLEQHLKLQAFLVGNQFTVADAYLVTVLNWVERAGLSLEPWPAVAAYRERLRQRPAVARAMQSEMAMLV